MKKKAYVVLSISDLQKMIKRIKNESEFDTMVFRTEVYEDIVSSDGSVQISSFQLIHGPSVKD